MMLTAEARVALDKCIEDAHRDVDMMREWRLFVIAYVSKHGKHNVETDYELCRRRAVYGSPRSGPQWAAWKEHWKVRWAVRRLTR